MRSTEQAETELHQAELGPAVLSRPSHALSSEQRAPAAIDGTSLPPVSKEYKCDWISAAQLLGCIGSPSLSILIGQGPE